MIKTSHLFSPRERLGYGEDQLKGRRLDFILNPWDLIKYEISLESILDGSSDVSTIALLSEKGWVIDAENTMIHGEWDRKPAIIWISRDISELRLSEKKFSTAFNSNSAVMAISTVSEGRYIDVNSSFLKLSGYSREEVIGKSSLELGVFDDPSAREKIRRIFLEKGCVRDFESKLRGKDGRIVHGIMSMDRFNLGDEPCWPDRCYLDLTALRKAENEKLEMDGTALLLPRNLRALGFLQADGPWISTISLAGILWQP
jgi:PAS domain S-box-containing protein